tara:strand:- start:22627 stop:24111 length:1485 start_codon:yes stop_codon:yes gene_type:complete
MEFIFPVIFWKSFLPIPILTFGAVMVLLFDIFTSDKNRKITFWLSIIVLLTTFVSCLLSSPETTKISFGGMYLFDGFTRTLFLIILFSSFLVVLISSMERKFEENSYGDFLGLILFATLGMMLMVSTRNLVMIFIALEIFSLSLYVLAGFFRSSSIGNEASLKYFLLGSFASGFLLFGIALIYGSTGSTDLFEIIKLYEISSQKLVFFLGLSLIIVGFGFKIGAFPFYMWTPDVYQGSPTVATAFMSVGPKVAAFAALFRVFIASSGFSANKIEITIWIIAVLTMTLGNLVAIWQTNIKRMLAYSSIAHAGYLLIALVTIKQAGTLSSASFLFYVFVYTFMNIGAFAVVMLAKKEDGKERILIEEFSGLGLTRPGLALSMAIFMIALAGIPPTGGFVAKFYIFSAAIKSDFVWLAIIAVLNSVVSVFYYLRVIVVMYMNDPVEDVKKEQFIFVWGSRLSYAVVALVICVIGTLSLGVFPSFFLDFALSSNISLN